MWVQSLSVWSQWWGCEGKMRYWGLRGGISRRTSKWIYPRTLESVVSKWNKPRTPPSVRNRHFQDICQFCGILVKRWSGCDQVDLVSGVIVCVAPNIAALSGFRSDSLLYVWGSVNWCYQYCTAHRDKKLLYFVFQQSLVFHYHQLLPELMERQDPNINKKLTI